MSEIINVTLKDAKKGEVTYKYITYMDKFKDMKPWLNIDETEWTYIKDTWDEETVKESLTVLLCSYDFPFKPISKTDVRIDFRKLCELDITDMTIVDEWFSKSNFDAKMDKELLKGTNTGLVCSDYFHQGNRYATELENSPSQIRVWNTPSMMRTLVNAFFTMKYPVVDLAKTRSSLALRKGVASQFKPSIARWVYDNYKAENILDTSMGWGDRLAGFYSSGGKNYVGIDPNSNLHKGYRSQAYVYGRLLEENNRVNDKTTEFIESPAEDADLSQYKNYFDLMFTSPPYFNREKYTDDDTQSWVRHRAIEDWLEKFLFKMIDNITPSIKSGGHMMINITDVCSTSKGRKKKGWLDITQPMLDYVAERGDWEFVKVMGYKMAKKPNLKSVGTGQISNGIPVEQFNGEFSYGEPVFIWKKK
jgi:hypothetical protein